MFTVTLFNFIKDFFNLDNWFLWHLAYQALTDDEARRNWEKYGNPDGPGAMSFGIALPSWIVEKENSVWVCTYFIYKYDSTNTKSAST